MNLSKRIIERSKAPEFKSNIGDDFEIRQSLKEHGAAIIVHFSTYTKEDEVYLKKAVYETNLKEPWLGVLDGFFALIQDRPIEAVDRFPVKELDFFLRDDNSISAFEGYDQKVYEILSVGEAMKEKLFPKKKIEPPKLEYPFDMMGLSEQLEFVEELFAHYYYGKDHSYSKLEIEDIENTNFYFSGAKADFDKKELKEFLEQQLSLNAVSIFFI